MSRSRYSAPSGSLKGDPQTWLPDASIEPEMAQLPRVPDLEAQRTAMRKIGFLAGEWVGQARLLRGAAEPVELLQTEEAQYKLDGLILMIEGIGRARTGGQPVLQALGIISYDDASGMYRLRAFNDGRFLETQVKLLDHGQGMTWGFVLGDIRTHSVMSIDEKGDWTELAEISVGPEPPKKLLELSVRRRT